MNASDFFVYLQYIRFHLVNDKNYENNRVLMEQ
jgi:hypothetical protein